MQMKWKITGLFAITLSMVALGGCMGGGGGSAETEYGTFTVTATATGTVTNTSTSTVTNSSTVTTTITRSAANWGVADPIAQQAQN